MEPVDDRLRFGEALLDDAAHAVREVHGHLLDQPAPVEAYALEGRNDILYPRPLDDGYERALARMAVLVGHDGVQLSTRQ